MKYQTSFHSGLESKISHKTQHIPAQTFKTTILMSTVSLSFKNNIECTNVKKHSKSKQLLVQILHPVQIISKNAISDRYGAT